MDKYGIKNITDEILNYDYDAHYRNVGIKLKNIKDVDECNNYRKTEQQKLSDTLNVQIDVDEVKKHLIDILLDDDSAKILWILYSKYDGEENYIDKLSNILKLENKVIRGGTNTYKMNGWMAHTLYVYQIANYNIPSNKELNNFNSRADIKNHIGELHSLYKKLDKDLIFVLRVFTLIHDIGVIEEVRLHPEIGVKYVDKCVEELGITEELLRKYGIGISLNDFNQILKVFVRHHILITMLSTEGSDSYVEDCYRELLNDLPDVKNIKELNTIILFIFAYGDIIGVDEKLMDQAKFNRVKEGFYFFEAVSKNKAPKRDKEKVAIERICDMVGRITYEELSRNFKEILQKNNINKDDFVEDMYNIKFMRFAGPLMKTVNNVELTIRVYAEIFDIIKNIDSKDEIKKYEIIFVPDKHEEEFAIHFNNGSFFECVKRMKMEKCDTFEFKNVRIELDKTISKKLLQIRIV